MPAPVDFQLIEGESRDIEFQSQYSDETAMPRTFIGRLFLYLHRRKDADPFLTLSDRNDALVDQPSQIQWTDEPEGEFTAHILSAHTVGQACTSGYFQLWVKRASDGQMIPIDEGTFDILPTAA